MKGTKIGIKEGIIICVALIMLSSFLGLFYAGVLILFIIAFNAYLLRKEKKGNGEMKEKGEVR